jgi:hypothetical protein
MDYGFAPGGTGYDKLGRLLLKRKPNTVVVEQRGIRDVEAFIDHLDTDVNITKPLGDLLIVSHGNASGWMAIDLDSSSVNPDGTPATRTTYKVLEQSVAVDPHTVEIPAALHDSEPDPVPFDVHIRGCRIGQARPFVEKLKEAFVRASSVTAPRHFHFAGGIGSSRKRRTRYGSYEYLSYAFELSRKNNNRLKTRTAAVNAFHAQGFTFIDESAIPKARWKRWIPKNLKRRKPRRWVKLGQNVGRNHRRFRLRREFRKRTERIVFPIAGFTENPGDRAERAHFFRNYISGLPAFQEDHAFPIYEREGFSSLEDFIDGHHWRYKWWKKKELRVVGSRRVYTVIVPIVDPATQHLLFNLFPANAASGLNLVTNLSHTDDRLFLTV